MIACAHFGDPAITIDGDRWPEFHSRPDVNPIAAPASLEPDGLVLWGNGPWTV
jgi:hypothetical protein